MAYILKTIGKSANALFKHFECDDVEDLRLIDTENTLMGSTCYVIHTNTLYTLNSNNEWKIRSIGSNNSGGNTGGGGLHISDDGDGNVTIVSDETTTITDDGNGNVTSE